MNLPERIRDFARTLPTSSLPTAGQVVARGKQRRRRRRGAGGALATLTVVALLAVAAVALGDANGGDEQVVVAGDPDNADSEATSAPQTRDPSVVPNLLAQPLSMARFRLDALGLGIEVADGDPTFDNAIVTEQDPTNGEMTAGTVRLRTIVPDPREPLGCDGSQPPRFPVPEVPTTDVVADRTAVEAVAARLHSEGRGDGILIGLWQRWARRRSGSELELVPFTGYQVLVVAADRDCTSSAPALIDGVPVTTVQGPLQSVGDRIWPPEEGQRVNIRVGLRLPTLTGELVDGRRYVVAADPERGLCVVFAANNIGCDHTGPAIQPDEDPATPRRAADRPSNDIAEDESGRLIYAYLPPDVTEVALVADDGTTFFSRQRRTEGAARFWAVPITPGEHPDEVIYRDSSGEEVARFPVGG